MDGNDNAVLHEKKSMVVYDDTSWHPIYWPSPVPRLWAYSKLFQNKVFAKLFSKRHIESPERVNDELPFYERYWYYFWSNEPTCILPNLFVGSAKNASDFESIQRNKFSLIVNATTEIENFFEKRDDIQYSTVPLDDSKDGSIKSVEVCFKETIQKMKEAIDKNQVVLCHCFMGASRSVAVICGYLITFQNMTFEDAYTFVQEKRKCAAINENFKQWLLNLETKK